LVIPRVKFKLLVEPGNGTVVRFFFFFEFFRFIVNALDWIFFFQYRNLIFDVPVGYRNGSVPYVGHYNCRVQKIMVCSVFYSPT
jgi:hypothetical protein